MRSCRHTGNAAADHCEIGHERSVTRAIKAGPVMESPPLSRPPSARRPSGELEQRRRGEDLLYQGRSTLPATQSITIWLFSALLAGSRC